MITYVTIDVRTYKKDKQVCVMASRRVDVNGESWSATKDAEFDTMDEALDWIKEQNKDVKPS